MSNLAINVGDEDMRENAVTLTQEQALAVKRLASTVVALEGMPAEQLERISGGLSLLDAITIGKELLDITCKATNGCQGPDGWPVGEHSPFQHGA